MQVTVAEAARLLKVSEHTIRRRLQRGDLQGHQVASQGGFAWMVEIPEDLQPDGPDFGGKEAMAALIARMEAQIEAQQEQLEAKDRQISELHVLLQQAQAALPPPRGKPWWKWRGSR